MFTSKNAAIFLDLKNNLETTQFFLLEVKQKILQEKGFQNIINAMKI